MTTWTPVIRGEAFSLVVALLSSYCFLFGDAGTNRGSGCPLVGVQARKVTPLLRGDPKHVPKPIVGLPTFYIHVTSGSLVSPANSRFNDCSNGGEDSFFLTDARPPPGLRGAHCQLEGAVRLTQARRRAPRPARALGRSDRGTVWPRGGGCCCAALLIRVHMHPLNKPVRRTFRHLALPRPLAN